MGFRGCYKCNSSKTNWDVPELFCIPTPRLVRFSTSAPFFCASFYIAVFLLNENDINIFEVIETRHFDASNYISDRRNPSSKSNK